MYSYRRHVLENRRLYAKCLVFMLLGISADAMSPVLISRLIDEGIFSARIGHALVLVVSLFLCFAARGVFKYVQEFTSDRISQAVIHDIRSDLVGHIERQNASFFRSNTPSELMSRVRHDAENIGFSFGFIGVFLVEIVIHCIVMMAFLLRISPQVFAVAIVMMPVIGLLAYREEAKGDAVFERISDETVALNRSAGEALGAIRTVKAFGCEEVERRRFSGHSRSFFHLNVSLETLFGRYDGAVSSLGRIMVALALLAGGVMTMGGDMSLGSLAAAMEYVNSLVWPMLEIGWVLTNVSQARASARKVSAVMNRHEEVPVRLPAMSRKDERGRNLEFDHVSYVVDGRRIVDDLSFSVNEGCSLGIMGATGSGKTTIVNLLMRFCDPTSGEIRIGGVDTTHLPVDELRRDIALVDQDIFLFSESVRENLKKGAQEELDDEAMMHAAALSQAHGFIDALSMKYDTVVGEKGVGLSGGQKQRLCIARALVRHSSVVVFDDSTSALDMETEKAVQHSLDTVSGDGVRIFIAHRISSVRNCDEIIFLDNGRVVERGTHESLMALGGLYCRTCMAQYGEASNERE